jgi:cytoskeletal protein CcmA (bactofilin family)
MGIFAKDKPIAAPAAVERSDPATSYFGAKLSVKGRVSGAGNLIVMGKIEGEFDLKGELVVAPTALVNGEVNAASVTVSGGLTGNVKALEKIHLETSAVVSGRLTTPRLSMKDGASFNGEIEMTKPSEGKPTASGPSPKEKK